PEPGTNLDLAVSFDVAVASCEHISAFGPYQVDDWLYCKAKTYLHKLECGGVRYKMIDVGYQPLNVSNCIHALTSFDRDHPRVRITRLHFGEVASYYVTRTYEPHIICPKQIH